MAQDRQNRGGEYLIIEPDKGEKIEQLRATWQVKLNKLAYRFHRAFVIRARLNRAENHVVLYREARANNNAKGAHA